MGSIKAAAAALCVTAAMGGFLSCLLPKKSLHSAMNLVLRLFFLASLCLCLTGIAPEELSFDLGETTSSHSGMELLVGEQVAENFRENIAAAAEDLLRQQGIVDAKVEVTVHITEQNIITINNIIVRTDAAVSDEVLTLLEGTFGVIPEVAT